MVRPNQNIINAIFEQSVIDALSLYGIDVPKRAEDTFSNYNPKKIYLRESVLSKLEVDWAYSNLISEINYIPPASGSGVGTYDSSKMRDVVRRYVKDEIYLETGRMEADAERKIAELIIEGDLLKKGGAKKAWDSLVATVSPDSAKFNKLMGTKVSDHEGYRKAVLDVIFTRTSGGLVSELGKLESVGGKVVGRPTESTVSAEGVVTPTPLKAGQTFTKGIIEILENPTREEKISTTITSEAEKIKKDFENHPDVKSRRDEIKEKMKTALVNSADYSRVQVLQREIEDLYESTPMGGTTYSTKQRLENELISTNRRVNGGALSGASGGTVPSLISSAREYQFFGSGRPTLSSVWESHPEIKIKIDEYTQKLSSSTDPIRRAYYQKKLDYYSDQYSLLGGSVANAFSFSFSNGEIVIKDRLREKYDRATKNFAQGLKFLDFSGELNRLRKEHLEVDLIVLQEMQDSLRKNYYRTRNIPMQLSAEEFKLLDSISKSTDNLVKRFAIHSQVLSLVESMRSVNPSNPDYLQLKNKVLANLAIYETDATKRKAIEDAINANDRRLLKQLINSGGGNTDFDKKHEKLYEDFIELTSKTDKALLSSVLRKRGYTDEQIKKFTTWANKRALDNEVIKGFVLRKQVETVIYAAQLMTDQKYLQKEVKRLIHQEVQIRLTTKLINLFPHNEYFGYSVGWFYELGSQDNKWEWLKKEGWKKIVSSFKENVEKRSYFIQLQSKLDSFSPYGVGLKLDFFELLSSPRAYIIDKGKYFAQNVLQLGLNKFFRKRVEDFWKIYARFKKSFRYFKVYVLSTIKNFLIKYGGALGARLVAILFAASIPVAGWVIGAVLAVLPVLLKPFFGDVDLITMLKKALKFVCLIPAMIFLLFFMMVIAPIVSLFSSVREFLSQYLAFNDFLYEYSMTNDWNFGVTGEFELTYEVADGLVTTSENKCLRPDGSALYPPRPGNASSWNNLKVEDFNNGIQSPKSLAMNCKILCNMQKYMLTLYPGVEGFINCNATQRGQGLFGNAVEGSADQHFWCTYAVTTAYGDDFTALSDDKKYASVFELNNYFNGQVGTNFEKIDLRECFEKDKIMSGAAIMMSKDSSCDIPNVKNTNHAAVFLKFEDNKFYYVNSNSGIIKEFVEFTDCGGGKVKLKDKAYSTTNIFKMCHAYQPLNVPDLLNSGRCPSQCIPDKLNY